MIGAYRTMSQKVELVADIGLLIYPGCALAAVYGLTDLFRLAEDWTGEPRRGIRVSHWQAEEAGVTCSWDSHPGLPHRLTHVISPPSIIMPERMAPAADGCALDEGRVTRTGRCCVRSVPGPSCWPRPG